MDIKDHLKKVTDLFILNKDTKDPVELIPATKNYITMVVDDARKALEGAK